MTNIVTILIATTYHNIYVYMNIYLYIIIIIIKINIIK